MKKIIYVFEDSGFENLLPLTYTTPVWEILCGIKTLLEKVITLYPDCEIKLICRDYLAEVARERTGLKVNDFSPVSTDTKCLFLNGRVVFEKPVPVAGNEETGVSGNTLVYARLDNKKAGKINSETFIKNRPLTVFSGLKTVEVKIPLINYFWDAIDLCPQQIISDFNLFVSPFVGKGPIRLCAEKRGRGGFSELYKVSKRINYKGVHKINAGNILIGKKTTIKPGVVLEAQNGPIFIGDNVIIESNSVIEGPAAIAKDCVVRAGAVIKKSSIGRCCRVGGEISESVIHSFSNKQHGGYLGSSYVGRWCNIGAGTNNSDLKNNYGNVKVSFGNRTVDTGRLHLGIMIADHSKCAVGTNFSCGSVVGVCSNVFGKAIAPKFIKSFSWGDDIYDIELAISTARVVMKRRGVDLSMAEETLLRNVFAMK